MANKGTSLAMNQILNTGDYLVSENGLFFVILQTDGNFVIYAGSGPNDNHGYVWGTQTAQGPGWYYAELISDGAIFIFRNEQIIWQSPGVPDQGPYTATIGNDGDLRVFNASGNPIWDTQTSALTPLTQGNQRFAAGNRQGDYSPTRRASQIPGQRPRAIVLDCADSRGAPGDHL
jgi:hypothetical protein